MTWFFRDTSWLSEEKPRKESDNRGNKRDDGGSAKDGQDHKDEDDRAVAAHDGLVFVGEVAGEQGGQDFFTVEGVDGDEVKNGQGDVEEDSDIN